MSGMVLTAEQMRQVRLNQPQLSWPEQEVIFRRNWQGLNVTMSETDIGSASSNGPGGQNLLTTPASGQEWCRRLLEVSGLAGRQRAHGGGAA